jgi:P-loop containing dynein motor region
MIALMFVNGYKELLCINVHIVRASTNAAATGCMFTLQNFKLLHLQQPHNQNSATTDSGTTQGMIEGAMEKRSKDKFGPTGGKQLICFIDDFNMPLKTSHESPFQPPLELLRFWMDHGE